MSKFSLSVLTFLLLLAVSSGSYADINDGLVVWYPFNDKVSAEARDRSGNGHKGNVYGATKTSDRFGTTWGEGEGKAYYFDGIDDYIEIPYSPDLQPSLFTVSFWIKTDMNSTGSTSRRGHIMNAETTSSCSHGWWLRLDTDGKISFIMDQTSSCGNPTNRIVSDVIVNDNLWHHVVAVYESALLLFVDGAQQSETVISDFTKTTAPLRIGNIKNVDGNINYLKGVLDDIRIYNRVLETTEIQMLNDRTIIDTLIQNPKNSHWYKRNANTMDWEAAKSYCEAFGGYLATITSQDENNFVYFNLAKNENAYQLGATDSETEGIWRWVTDEPWDFTNWSPGQPDNSMTYGGQDYLSFYSRHPYRWDDGREEEGFWKFSICEWNNLDDLINVLAKTDIDDDGDVDGMDLSIFIESFGIDSSSPDYNVDVDFEEDGDVDQFDVAPFSYRYGNVEVPSLYEVPPVLNQHDYTDTIDIMGDLLAGGCTPTSFTMMFLGYLDEYKEYAPQGTIDSLNLPSYTDSMIEDVALHLTQNVTTNDFMDYDGWEPGKLGITEQMVLDEMDAYSYTFQFPEENIVAEWQINYFNAQSMSQDELIQFIKDRLDGQGPNFSGRESVFFGALVDDGDHIFGHASVITGYAELDGHEYFRVNDTFDTQATWLQILRNAGPFVYDNKTYDNPLRLKGHGREWYLIYSVADPISLNFVSAPIY